MRWNVLSVKMLLGLNIEIYLWLLLPFSRSANSVPMIMSPINYADKFLASL